MPTPPHPKPIYKAPKPVLVIYVPAIHLRNRGDKMMADMKKSKITDEYHVMLLPTHDSEYRVQGLHPLVEFEDVEEVQTLVLNNLKRYLSDEDTD